MFKKKYLAAIAIILALASQTGAADHEIIRGYIVKPGATVETVFDKGFWLEGPAVGPDGRVYFSDITMTFNTNMGAGTIWAYDPKSGATSVFRSPSGMSNGIKFDRAGGMIVAQGADFGGRQLIRTDPITGLSKIVAGLYEGRPFNSPNDLDIDEQGRVYFTDPRYFGREPIEQPVMGIYRIETDGAVKLLSAEARRPNGIVLSPDGKTLYVSDNDIGMSDIRVRGSGVPVPNGVMRILSFKIDKEGNVGKAHVFVDFGEEQGADGLTVDREGNLYAAVQSATRFGVRVYDPKGREIASIRTEKRPTNLTLATIESRTDLYITAGGALYRIETTVPARRYK
ncbi:SMP-30/gluconolactonase/LRE family protein [Neorhizobium sp. DT-125]|uniref:SMP-30/gluconolactonase/LRE family protein n=1 Tax=Neorhizobium sp. DT-125 TaxID=3396163 RepID=UPI003F1B3898